MDAKPLLVRIPETPTMGLTVSLSSYHHSARSPVPLTRMNSQQGN